MNIEWEDSRRLFHLSSFLFCDWETEKREKNQQKKASPKRRNHLCTLWILFLSFYSPKIEKWNENVCNNVLCFVCSISIRFSFFSEKCTQIFIGKKDFCICVATLIVFSVFFLCFYYIDLTKKIHTHQNCVEKLCYLYRLKQKRISVRFRGATDLIRGGQRFVCMEDFLLGPFKEFVRLLIFFHLLHVLLFAESILKWIYDS